MGVGGSRGYSRNMPFSMYLHRCGSQKQKQGSTGNVKLSEPSNASSPVTGAVLGKSRPPRASRPFSVLPLRLLPHTPSANSAH